MADSFFRDCDRSYGYYSGHAKLINGWRDQPKDVHCSCEELYGLDYADQTCKLLPPRCLSGRWQSMSRCECLLKKWGPDDVKERAKRMHAVFAKAFKKTREKDADVKPDGPDAEFVVEELRAMRETMGRWRRDTLITTKDTLFHVMNDTLLLARGPIDHLFNYMSKGHGNLCEEFEHGELRGPVGELATGKAAVIAEEFEMIIDDDAWYIKFQEVLRGEHNTPECDAAHFARFCFLIVLHHAAAFDSRIFQFFDGLLLALTSYIVH